MGCVLIFAFIYIRFAVCPDSAVVDSSMLVLIYRGSALEILALHFGLLL